MLLITKLWKLIRFAWRHWLVTGFIEPQLLLTSSTQASVDKWQLLWHFLIFSLNCIFSVTSFSYRVFFLTILLFFGRNRSGLVIEASVIDSDRDRKKLTIHSLSCVHKKNLESLNISNMLFSFRTHPVHPGRLAHAWRACSGVDIPGVRSCARLRRGGSGFDREARSKPLRRDAHSPPQRSPLETRTTWRVAKAKTFY